ncbi:MAG: hypothetical protein LDL55_06305 [Armatimonadetes bacterium]|nr:hypothetical protein [Armatimonadota bacterium]
MDPSLCPGGTPTVRVPGRTRTFSTQRVPRTSPSTQLMRALFGSEF